MSLPRDSERPTTSCSGTLPEMVEVYHGPQTEPPARIHLLPAKSAPYVVALRRKPTNLFHVMRWNTATGDIEAGSWFRGQLYEERSDLSYDGEWMLYCARGKGEIWTAVCHPPKLKAIAFWEEPSSHSGGGYFSSEGVLTVYSQPGNQHVPAEGMSFQIESTSDYWLGVSMLYRRLMRDGFQPVDPRRPNPAWTTEKGHEDPGLLRQPTPDHPILRVRNVGTNSQKERFIFDLPDRPGILDNQVSWAVYDSLGQLVFGRAGILYRYTLEDILRGIPSQTIDIRNLQPRGRLLKAVQIPRHRHRYDRVKFGTITPCRVFANFRLNPFLTRLFLEIMTAFVLQ